MKNIQIMDRAVNATFSLFQATDDEFAAIFPGPGQDIELIEDFTERAGEEQALRINDHDRDCKRQDAGERAGAARARRYSLE